MKSKVTKFICGDIANITVNHFKCSKDSILKIMNLFEYETLIIEVGDVEKNSSLFQAIKTLSINYTTSLYDNLPYTDVALMLNVCNLEELIYNIFTSERESFSINGVDFIQWEQYLENRFNMHQLIKRKIVTLSMVVAINEFLIDINFHKDIHNSEQVFLKIKRQLGISPRC